jgi:hypothetical protein
VIADRHFFKGCLNWCVRQHVRAESFTFRGLSVICERQPGALRDARVFLLHEIMRALPAEARGRFLCGGGSRSRLVLHLGAALQAVG